MPLNEPAEHGNGEGVLSVPVLVDQAGLGQILEHLARPALAETFHRLSLRCFDNLLNSKLILARLQPGDDFEQVALAVGRSGPPDGEEIAIEFLKDRTEGLQEAE